MRGRRALTLALKCAVGAASVGAGLGEAAADRMDLGGELRADGNLGFGSPGQFGSSNGSGPCGGSAYAPPTVDGGGDLTGSATVLFSSARYRHQLTGSLGYDALYCTPQLRRVVGGIDYRGEHALSDRTRFSFTVRYVTDVFDRSFDSLGGTLTGNTAKPVVLTTVSLGGSAGLRYTIGQAGAEVTHAFTKLYGLRAGVHLNSLEVLGPLNQLPDYSTLGPMESVQFFAIATREHNRNRYELPLHYRVTNFYPRTFLDVRSRSQVPAAHDLQLSPVWERKLSPKLTLHVEAGVAIGVQPQLCLQLDPLLIGSNRCSIDARAPGIRGYDGAPPLEAQLGRLGTITPAAEVSLAYQGPRRRFEVHYVRGYEPEPYAGALSLIDRLSGDVRYRPIWDLLLYGNAQFLHSSQTSPARVDPIDNGVLQQPLSPQNRSLWMAMGVLGADYHVTGPLSVYFLSTFQAMRIRGEKVPQIPSQGAALATQVAPFETGTATTVGTGADALTITYANPYRVSLLLGVRAQFDTLPSTRREPDLFTETRAIP
jgi:hypothetical protein